MVAFFFLTGCRTNDGGGNAAVATVPTSTAQPVTAGGPISIQIISPLEGSKQPNPVKLNVQATGIQIAPASEQVAGAAHFHAFLDMEPVPEGARIPSGTGIFHFMGSVDVPVTGGDHTITVVLGDNAHVRLKAVPTAQVTFTVGQ